MTDLNNVRVAHKFESPLCQIEFKLTRADAHVALSVWEFIQQDGYIFITNLSKTVTWLILAWERSLHFVFDQSFFVIPCS